MINKFGLLLRINITIKFYNELKFIKFYDPKLNSNFF
jgi:hypothetical protein